MTPAGQAGPQAPLDHFSIAVLGVITICVYGAWYYAFGVLLDPIRADTGWSETALGSSYSWGLLLIGLGSVIGGRLVDRAGSRFVFLLAAVLGGGAFAVASTASSATVFVPSAALGMGVFGALGFYHVTMTVAVRANPDQPTRSIAVLTFWGAVASAIFLPLAAWLLDHYDWRTTMRLLVGAAVVSLVIGAFVVSVPPGAAAQERLSLVASIRVMWANRLGRLFMAILAVGGVCWTSLLVYQVPTMTAVGLPLATASFVAGLRGFCQILGRLPLGWIVARITTDGAMMLSFATMVVGGVFLSFSGTLPIAIAFAVVAGFGVGAFSPLQGMRGEQLYEREMLGAAMGLHTTIVMLAGASAPIVIGAIADRTGERRWVSVIVVITGLIAIGLVQQLRRATAPDG